jgi:alginate O-acetyltransferase complex protein AlgI
MARIQRGSALGMLFTEPLFFLFFVVVFSLYWSVRVPVFQKLLLLIASYVFYAAWDWRFLSLIWISTLVDYVAGYALDGSQSRVTRRIWLVISLVVNLGFLAVFKYFDFFVSSTGELLAAIGLPVELRTLQLVLPVGISFYTFQTLSYSIDIYLGRLKHTNNLLDFALFVGFFPQLVAGPIVRAIDFLPQLSERHRLRDVKFRQYLTLFLVGYFKKTVVSDNLAIVVDTVFADPQGYDSLSHWLAAVFYSIQIYCDFSGYSDMAIATAGLLGFRLCENFNFPYLAANITEFWRRWHISLSSWIRDYLYIPLGGSRGSGFATHKNLLITMTLCGLWHGAAWTFVVWGLLHGGALSLHRIFRSTQLAERLNSRWLQPVAVAITFLWAVMTFVVFRAADFSTALTVIQSCLLFSGPGAEQVNPYYALALIPLFGAHLLAYRFRPEQIAGRLPGWLVAIGLGIAVVLVLPFVPVSYRPFIYFQF